MKRRKRLRLPRARLGAPAVKEVGDARGAASSAAPEAPDGIIRAVPMPSAPLDVSKPVSRILFASCAQQNENQSLWDRMAAERPDLTLFIGDNVYGDVRSNDPGPAGVESRVYAPCAE